MKLQVQTKSSEIESGIGLSALLLAAVLICLYFLTFQGAFRIDDEHIFAARAQSFSLWTTFEQPQVWGNQRVQALTTFGDPATQIEPAQAVLGSLFYRLGLSLDSGGAQSLFLQNLLITAITAACVVLIIDTLGYSKKTAVICGLLFGVGSMAWPYAETYYRDPLVMLMAAVVFLGLALMSSPGSRKLWLGLALLVGGVLLGTLAKNSMLAILPALGILFIINARKTKTALQKDPLLFYAGLGVLLLIFVVVRWIPEGGPLARFSGSYYRDLAGFFRENIRGQTITAFLGPFLSPARSIFLFSPPLLLIPLGISSGLRRHRNVSVAAMAFAFFLALSQALFYGEDWAGIVGWSARFMLPALPGLFVLTAPVVEVFLQKGMWFQRILLWLSLLSGIVIQLSGVLIPWQAPYLEWMSTGGDPFRSGAAWTPSSLVLPYHLQRLTSPNSWSLAWNRMAHTDIGGALTLIGLIIVVGVGLTYLLGRTLEEKRTGRPKKTLVWVSITAAIVFPILFLVQGLTMLRSDPYWGGTDLAFSHSMEGVRNQATDNDVIVINAYGTKLWEYWINQWDHSSLWFSLPFELGPMGSADVSTLAPIPENNQSLFESFSGSYERLWYITIDEAPNFLFDANLAWITERYTQVEEEPYIGDNRIEVYLFNLTE